MNQTLGLGWTDPGRNIWSTYRLGLSKSFSKTLVSTKLSPNSNDIFFLVFCICSVWYKQHNWKNQ